MTEPENSSIRRSKVWEQRSWNGLYLKFEEDAGLRGQSGKDQGGRGGRPYLYSIRCMPRPLMRRP